ncbi:MAG TPA: sialidase family protein [Candidatus Eisenbacteria bacterium]|jgi:hypothetical protein
MEVSTKVTRSLALVALSALVAGSAFAAKTAQTPTYPNDLSPAGMRAAAATSENPAQFEGLLPEGALEAVQEYVAQTRKLGLPSRNGTLLVPTNIQVNSNAGDRVGETQSEVSIAVFGDTVVIGWNDSRGFLGGGITLSSYGYSTDGGNTFTDGGNVPLALPTDQAFGDTGWDTDEKGNWYLVQIYTRTAGNPDPTAEQNIAVHHARFVAGVLTLDPPVQASIGTSALGNLDKCLLAVDRVTNNVYAAYTRFTAVPQIEIVRSTTLGATWGPATVLDNGATPTSSKQAARPFCGPAGEVYVVWEKGANSIFCPDGAGNIASFNAQIGFTRSLNFGVTYDPVSIIGNPVTDFLAGGPGDLRDRGNEFPDIAVDRTGGCYNGNLYVTWHDGAPWSANTSAGPVVTELVANNNNPGTPDLFTIGDDVTGQINPAADLDYWQFSATQGQNLMIDVLPQGFNCGVTGTTRGMRVRMFATTAVYPNPTGFPDSLLAGSFVGAFENRIVWTAPRTGTYLIRLQISSGTTTGTYTMRVRPLTFGAPSPARDARDVVVVRSSNQGGTWTAPQLVNDDAAGLENRRPFVTVDGQGHVSTYWHDSRTAGFGSTASLTSVYGTTSRDGGVTWTPNYSVTDELSFFSFNTIAVPNLGDYNQAAAWGDRIHPAWSDQRISTGDVRTPGTNTYTAGSGPNAVTTTIRFAFTTGCPLSSTEAPGSSVVKNFVVNNTGNVADSYSYSITDVAGWIGGPINGTAGPVAAGGNTTIPVKVSVSPTCTPSSDVITFTVNFSGEGCLNPIVCTTTVTCDQATPALVAGFWGDVSGGGVDLRWSSRATDQIQGWNLYRSSSADGPFALLNAHPIPMGTGGEFRFHDAEAPAGALYYQLSGLMVDGRESRLESIQLTGAAERALEFRLAGANPFSARTMVHFTLPQRSTVRLEVFSVGGQKLRTLVNEERAAGTYNEELDLRAGARLGAGLYVIRLTAGGQTRTLRVAALE